MKTFVRTAVIAVLGLAVQASAEPRVCIGGDLDHLSVSQKNGCRALADQVRSEAVTFHAPSDWHFFVVCTEADWTTYSALSERGGSVASLNADTDIERHMTFFRGAALAIASPSRVRRLIAHEAASGLLGSSDETAIAKQVSLWLPAEGRSVEVLTASR